MINQYNFSANTYNSGDTVSISYSVSDEGYETTFADGPDKGKTIKTFSKPYPILETPQATYTLETVKTKGQFVNGTGYVYKLQSLKEPKIHHYEKKSIAWNNAPIEQILDNLEDFKDKLTTTSAKTHSLKFMVKDMNEEMLKTMFGEESKKAVKIDPPEEKVAETALWDDF
jgi:hypothetical protein